MRGMVANMIVGLGLFQGLEYLLERSAREIAGKMGRDPEDNARMVIELAEQILGGREAHP
jgi:hypothetical protein